MLRNFDTDLDQEGVVSKTVTDSLRVVGVTFVPSYPDNLLALARVLAQAEADGSQEGVAVVLIRNPNNEHDPNAIEVHVPALGQIGHVPRELAAEMAPRLDAGEKVIAAVVSVRIQEGHEDRPGVIVRHRFIKEQDA
jgi:hypothetical protein